MVDTTRLDLVQATQGCTLHLSFVDAGDMRELEVKIPAGVHSGQKLRLRGQGGKGQGGGENGDLYLHIELKPHPQFRVDHHDLYFDLTLTPWEAMLGAEVAVPTLTGDVLLTVPGGTSSGKKLRLRGRGLPKKPAADATRGDMYALVGIAVPATLTPQERALLEELSRICAFAPRHRLTGTPDEHITH
jgi:curved DNA-binding protein